MDKFIRNEQMRKHFKHSKSDRAITLIALIVTIIILLILAGVVINLGLNNRGLFSRAKISTRKWKESEGNEQQSLQDVVDYIDNLEGEKERIDADVKKALEYADSMGAEEDDTIDPTPGILDGDGTEANPYKIQSIEDLVAFSYNVNSGTNTYKDKTVALQRNLHFDGSYNSYTNPNAKYETVSGIGYKPSDSGSKTIKELVTTDIGFIPISNAPVQGRSLEGNFDGGNHRLVGLYEKDNAGLFEYITSPIKISNLSLRDGSTGGIVGNAASDITISNCYNAPSKTDNLATGGIIGRIVDINTTNNINATISHCYNIGKNKSGGIIGQVSYYSNIVVTIKMDNCYNTGDVTDTSSSSSSTGGIIGYCKGNVIMEKCYNTGKVDKGAGIAGQVDGEATIEKCYNTVDVNGENAGGIISHVFGKLTATECYNTGNITGSSSDSGGIIGMAHSDATIENCHNTGKVTRGAGIVSHVFESATIENCNNTGKITGGAGIVSTVNGKATITDCSNTGEITGSSSDSGGIIGMAGSDTTIENCHNAGNIIVEDNCNVGGIIGQTNSNTTIENCYNTVNIIAEKGSAGGIVCKGDTTKITNCYNTGKIISNGTVGGIVVYGSDTTIENCYNTGNIIVEDYSAGGIVCNGYRTKITNCYNTGKIISNGDFQAVGGIVVYGSEGSTATTNCYNTGDLKIKNGTAGGIMVFRGKAIGCYNTGNVTASSGSFGAGIISGDGTAINCYNTGTITGTNAPTGGIIGYNGSATNCYNTGIIKCGDDSAGGIIGMGDTAINCYNQGNVTGKRAGGIMASGKTATNCYNTGTITGTGSAPTGGILGYGESKKSTNCHNTGDIKMNTPDPNIMYEIGGADNTCTYLLKSTNAKQENAVGKKEEEMKQIMDMNNFVKLMNTKVEENNRDSNNTKLKKWELKDQMPVFSNN